MKNKWSAEKVRLAQAWLRSTWPRVFTDGSDKIPLSIQVHKAVLAHPDRPDGISRRAIMEALKRHTTSFGYLYGLLKSPHRYSLDLEPVEEISAEHKLFARDALRQKQKISQAQRRQARKQRTDSKRAAGTRQPIVVRKSRTPLEPKISYKRPKRRIAIRPTQSPASQPEAA